jgi:hypothetical protein
MRLNVCPSLSSIRCLVEIGLSRWQILVMWQCCELERFARDSLVEMVLLSRAAHPMTHLRCFSSPHGPPASPILGSPLPPKCRMFAVSSIAYARFRTDLRWVSVLFRRGFVGRGVRQPAIEMWRVDAATPAGISAELRGG